MSDGFQYMDFDVFSDGEIKLIIKTKDEPDEPAGILPRYGFAIVRIVDSIEVGIVFFTADTTRRQYLRGHLSYGIAPEYRGNGYAAKACRLIRHVALAHGYSRVFVGSQRDNIASTKTIAKLGAKPLAEGVVQGFAYDEIVAQLKEDGTDMYYWDILDEVGD